MRNLYLFYILQNVYNQLLPINIVMILMIMNLMYFFSTNKLKINLEDICMYAWIYSYCIINVLFKLTNIKVLYIILPVYNINVGQILKE